MCSENFSVEILMSLFFHASGNQFYIRQAVMYIYLTVMINSDTPIALWQICLKYYVVCGVVTCLLWYQEQFDTLNLISQDKITDKITDSTKIRVYCQLHVSLITTSFSPKCSPMVKYCFHQLISQNKRTPVSKNLDQKSNFPRGRFVKSSAYKLV